MSDLDPKLRDVLRGLRAAPVPEAPAIRPAAPERRSYGLAGLAAAAAMLLVLVASLWSGPREEGPTPAAVSGRLKEIEARVSGVAHEELRTLLERELALLRRELELASSP